jgi:hypothetical protein
MSAVQEEAAREMIASIARERAELATPDTGSSYAAASTESKPTPKQLYRIARETLELLGLEWPANRRAASELIGQLVDANRARAGGMVAHTGEPMPF